MVDRFFFKYLTFTYTHRLTCLLSVSDASRPVWEYRSVLYVQYNVDTIMFSVGRKCKQQHEYIKWSLVYREREPRFVFWRSWRVMKNCLSHWNTLSEKNCFVLKTSLGLKSLSLICSVLYHRKRKMHEKLQKI